MGGRAEEAKQSHGGQRNQQHPFDESQSGHKPYDAAEWTKMAEDSSGFWLRKDRACHLGKRGGSKAKRTAEQKSREQGTGNSRTGDREQHRRGQGTGHSRTGN